jgi:NAD kinase
MRVLITDEVKRQEFIGKSTITDLAAEVDLVITLGGDGSLLYVNSVFQNRVPPVMPFHGGSLGFVSIRIRFQTQLN